MQKNPTNQKKQTADKPNENNHQTESYVWSLSGAV